MFRDIELALGAVMAVLAFAPAVAAPTVAPLGVFLRPSTGTQVEFYDCAGKVCGKIVAVSEASRSKEIGMVIVKDAVTVTQNVWKGSLSDPDSGQTYTGVVSLDGADLKLKGCVLGFLCKSETWPRVH